MMLFVLMMIFLGAVIAGIRLAFKIVFKKIDEKIIQAQNNLENGKAEVKIKQSKGR